MWYLENVKYISLEQAQEQNVKRISLAVEAEKGVSPTSPSLRSVLSRRRALALLERRITCLVGGIRGSLADGFVVRGRRLLVDSALLQWNALSSRGGLRWHDGCSGESLGRGVSVW